jgi:hypothetical protein
LQPIPTPLKGICIVTIIENPAKTVLKDSAAINLWLSGKDTWNAWLKNNPKADVSFCGINFVTQLKNESINFDGTKSSILAPNIFSWFRAAQSV